MNVEQIGDFTYLRPVFYLLFIVALSNLLYLSILIKKIRTETYVVINSLFILVISSLLLFQSGVITDELSLSGDHLYFFASAAIFVIFVLSLITYFKKHN